MIFKTFKSCNNSIKPNYDLGVLCPGAGWNPRSSRNLRPETNCLLSCTRLLRVQNPTYRIKGMFPFLKISFNCLLSIHV